VKALLQRVTRASVEVEGDTIGAIGPGLLVFVGIEPEDDEAACGRMLKRLLEYRVFADSEQRMNLSLQDVEGGLLLVSQFTLAADTRSGRRPSFSTAAPPAQGEQLFNHLAALARDLHPAVQTGRFGADMQVSLVNDGPVTFLLSI
jgi:D-tyrosyl-tRNA(Tyr) deacylase